MSCLELVLFNFLEAIAVQQTKQQTNFVVERHGMVLTQHVSSRLRSLLRSIKSRQGLFPATQGI